MRDVEEEAPSAFDDEELKTNNELEKLHVEEHEEFSTVGIVDRYLDSFVDKFTLLLLKWPFAILMACYAAVFVCIGVLIAIGWSTSPSSNYDWDLQFDHFTIKRDMIEDAVDRVDSLTIAERSDETWRMFFAYDAHSDYHQHTCKGPFGVLSGRSLQAICEFERELLDFENFELKYCVLENGQCKAPVDSLSYIFYGGIVTDPNSTTVCGLLSDESIESTFEMMRQNPSNYDFLLEKDAFNRGWPCSARSIIPIGSPLAGSSSVAKASGGGQFEKMQRELTHKFEQRMQDTYDLENGFMRSRYLYDALDKLRKGESGRKIDMMFWSAPLEQLEWQRMFGTDSFVAGFSALFVLIWMTVHTGSAFIGILGLLQILMSFPLAIFIYRCILQIEFYQILQSLVIFVVLGIGADDIFVFSDAWIQALEVVGPDEEQLHARLKYAYSRALTAIFNTSFTTIAAFCATTVSRVMPITTFGAFAACCVFTNYLLAITMTPALFVVQHRYCCCKKKRTAPEQPDEESKYDDEPVAKSKGGAEYAIELYLQLMQWQPFGDGGEPSETRVGSLGRSIRRKPVPWVCIVALGTVGAVCAGAAARLEPPTKPEEWYQRRHQFQRLQDLFKDKFTQKEDTFYPPVQFVWGMSKLRRPDFDQYQPRENRGDVKFSTQRIDLADSAQVDELFGACSLMRDWACESACEVASVEEQGTRHLMRPDSVVCVVEEFDEWLRSTYNSTIYDTADVMARLQTFRDATVPQNSNLYSSWKEIIGFVNGELRYLTLEGSLSMELEDGVRLQKKVLRRTNKLKDKMRDVTPSLPNNLFQVSYVWIWYKLNKALVEGMVYGMIITFPIAAIAMIASTKNFLLSFFAITTIGCIVAEVLALAYFLGWALGVKETIAAVIVIGLAVDYTLHLGHMYEHARVHLKLKSREDKFRSATKAMGVTVLSGAITTAGSGSLMYACQSTFFIQMATLIVATILLSITYSLFFFIPLLYVAGPEADQGNILVLYATLKGKLRSSTGPPPPTAAVAATKE